MSISNSPSFFSLTLLSLYFLILSNRPVLATPFPVKMDQENGIPTNTINSTNPPPPSTGVPGGAPFKPGITAIMGLLAIVVSIAILLLIYVQYCNSTYVNYANNSRALPLSRENSGVDKKVIQLLPLFRFASLKGQKDGLECAVCLTKFDADEVLRLLPKCKHAFHVECVDTWLDTHSTCPLCRYRVDPKDVLLIDHHESYKSLYNYKDTNVDHSGRHSSSHGKGKSLEIIVENPEQDTLDRSSSGGSKSGQGKETLCRDLGSKSLDSWKTSRKDDQVKGNTHRVDHRIIISSGAEGEEEAQRRWSDVGGVDFLYLRSEMLMGGDEVEGSGRGVISGRSVSEMTGMRWYRDNNVGERGGKEDGIGKRWFAWISRSQREKTDMAPPQSSTSNSV